MRVAAHDEISTTTGEQGRQLLVEDSDRVDAGPVVGTGRCVHSEQGRAVGEIQPHVGGQAASQST